MRSPKTTRYTSAKHSSLPPDAKSNENFVIKVTDSELLSRCGGIVQGMSGSPIVQDGKLAGAVTHVFLETPEEGYGIMAQNMVSNYQS